MPPNTKRTKLEKAAHLQLGLNEVIQNSPGSQEWYKWYMAFTEMGIRTAAKDYILVMKLYATELAEATEEKRTKRIQELETMLKQITKKAAEIDPEKLYPMQLQIQKQIAQLEGLNNFKQEVEHSGVNGRPLFGNIIYNGTTDDKDAGQDPAAEK